jgi:hypothetical protein
MISAPISPCTIAEITDALVSALQAQGLVRSAYPSKDLRDTLFEFGLAPPALHVSVKPCR